MYRLKWKENLIEQYNHGFYSAPTKVEQINGSTTKRGPIEMKGRLLNGRNVLLGPRKIGEQFGYFVISPFELDSGQRISLNRGWIPTDAKSYWTQCQLNEKSSKIIGVVEEGDSYSLFSPRNDAEKNLWILKIIPEISMFQNTQNILVRQLASVENEPWPKPIEGIPKITNNHLQYCVTWFSLAAITTAMFFVKI